MNSELFNQNHLFTTKNNLAKMEEQLIVDFPSQRTKLSCRSVEFAETAVLCIVKRHDDNDEVDRRDLWYDDNDYSLMKLDAVKAARQTHELISAGVPIHYIINNDIQPDYCLVGIEHILTRANALDVKKRRSRTTQAVLHEQARQIRNPSPNSRWDSIALASCIQTREAMKIAQQRAELQHHLST